MKQEPDETYFIPVIDCFCGAEDTPLTHKGTFSQEGYPDIEV